jgi:hypothetical protein
MRPLGLLVDPRACISTAAAPSALERILATDPLDNSNLLPGPRTGLPVFTT